MSTIVFIVPGTPSGQKRPRFFTGKDGKPHAHKDRKDNSRENLIALSYREEAGDIPPHPGPVGLVVHASYIPPTSWSKKKRQAALNGELFKDTKPDLDNVIKSVKDGLNRIAWLDDKQVVKIAADKKWSEWEQTIVMIERL